jgi:hypothetical protein
LVLTPSGLTSFRLPLSKQISTLPSKTRINL